MLSETSQDLTDAETSNGEELELKASTNGLDFLSSVGPTDIDCCLFADSLVTLSDSGSELGEFCVDIKKATYNNEPCYLVHGNSHGAIDGIPCGTSIIAYISESLGIIDENQHEYMKEENTLEKKIHMERQDDHLVVKTVITEKEEYQSRTFTYPLDFLQGFVSEASNLLVMRILAQKRNVPENMSLLSFDNDSRVAISTYKELGSKQQTVGTEVMDVFGIERTTSVPGDTPATWHCYFLSDGMPMEKCRYYNNSRLQFTPQYPITVLGLTLTPWDQCNKHLASRVKLGSQMTTILLQLPLFDVEDEKEPKPVFERRPLIWEDDMELYSKFLDRKEESKADHSSYIRHHPELKAMLADFLQFLLLRKPPEVFTFTRDFFASLSVRFLPCSAFKASRTVTHDKVVQDNN